MSVEEFFSALANDFESGALDRLGQAVATPTSIYFGEKLLLIDDCATAMKFAEIYRSRLVEKGYLRTECKILEKVQTVQSRAHLKVEVCHFDASGNRLSKSRGIYYCVCNDQKKWAISLVEYDVLQLPVFISGAPLL